MLPNSARSRIETEIDSSFLYERYRMALFYQLRDEKSWPRLFGQLPAKFEWISAGSK